MRPLLEPLTEQMGDSARHRSPGPLRSASGLLLGVQLGALTGCSPSACSASTTCRCSTPTSRRDCCCSAPNLAIAARTLDVDRDELVAWVTIHEITHAVQFSGAPWLRGHLGGMLRELLDGLR